MLDEEGPTWDHVSVELDVWSNTGPSHSQAISVPKFQGYRTCRHLGICLAKLRYTDQRSTEEYNTSRHVTSRHVTSRHNTHHILHSHKIFHKLSVKELYICYQGILWKKNPFYNSEYSNMQNIIVINSESTGIAHSIAYLSSAALAS